MRRRAYLSAVAGVSVAGCSAVGGAGWGSDGGQRRPDLSVERKFFGHPHGNAVVGVKISNNSEFPANSLVLEVDWFDGSGNFLSTDHKYLIELGAGTAWFAGVEQIPGDIPAQDFELELNYKGGAAQLPENISVRIKDRDLFTSNPSVTGLVDNQTNEEQYVQVEMQFFGYRGIRETVLNAYGPPPETTLRFDVDTVTSTTIERVRAVALNRVFA